VVWELAKQTDPDVDPLSRRLLRSIAHATQWRAEYRTARDGLDPPADPTASSAPLIYQHKTQGADRKIAERLEALIQTDRQAAGEPVQPSS
jgi:hypothetical protein